MRVNTASFLPYFLVYIIFYIIFCMCVRVYVCVSGQDLTNQFVN